MITHYSLLRPTCWPDADTILFYSIGSIVEIILFLVLLLDTRNDLNKYDIIRAAILGSILATMLLCLGLCFFAAGLRREMASFDAALSEVGTGLLLMAYEYIPHILWR
jgi:Ca2+:H+ antiporter